jgi:ERCC4-type nuclease
MIFVSPEQGSKDLVEPLAKAGLEVNLVKLDYADVEFVGRGDKGVPVSVGIEVKQLNELTSDWDRFAGHQVPKMVEHYDYRWLLYEGEWKQDRKGTLMRRTGASTFRPLHGQSNASSLRKKLLGLSLRAGVLTWASRDRVDTVRFLVDLYRMWTDEDFDKHRSHLVVYQPHGLLVQSDFVRAVGAWPHMGLQRARVAEHVFKGSVRRAAMAGVTEWANIETSDDNGKTRKIGVKVATQIDNFLEGKQ